MTVDELRDRERIAAFCRHRPAVQAYLLGDLDDFFWPHTRWYGWAPEGSLEQLALVYDEVDPPVLLAFAEGGVDGLTGAAALLRSIAPGLPPRLYAHLTPDLLDALAPTHAPVSDPVLHAKLGLADPSRLAAHDTEQTELLGPADLSEVEAFYACAYPGTWFQPRMLETDRYVGIRRGGELACVAGVHVVSPAYRVAALGNVATLPDARGSGLATAACARLCRLLLDDGIDVISLNVRADNTAALRAYEKLGFAHAADYVEVSLAGAGQASVAVETRLGAYAVLVDRHERILLALWNEGPAPAWTLPGGGVEPGETPEQAAVRETREETGYDVELVRLLGEDSSFVAAADRLDGSGRSLRSHRYVYEARIVGGELQAEVGGTTDRADWIPLCDVPALERVGLVDVALRLVAEARRSRRSTSPPPGS